MSYKTVKLGDICDLANGYAFKSEDYVEHSGTLNCRMSNIRPGGQFDIDYNPKFLPDVFADKYKQFLLKDGDVVIAMTDLASSPKILGVPTIVKTKGRNILLNQRVGKLVIRDKEKVHFPYLKLVLNYPKTRAVYEKFAGGGLQINLGKADLLSVTIPLPPLDEQKRIAEILDKADALREKRRLALAKLDTLLQSVFLEMFGNGKAIPFVNATLKPRENPNNWRWEKLTNIARLATGHTPSRKIPEYWGGDIPWITLTDIRRLDGRITYETSEYTNELGIKKSSAVLLPERTVCLSRTASVGFVTIMGREMATSQDFVNWVCSGDLNPTYLMWALIFSRNSIKSLSSGTTHKTIYFPTVEDFHALVPPIELQKKFEKIANHVAKKKNNLELSALKFENLFQSLQQKAFKGELMAGDAEVLKAV